MNNELNKVVHALFPTPVGIYKLNREITKTELDFVKNLKTQKNVGNLRSVNDRVLLSSQLKELQKFFQDCVDDYFSEIYNPETSVKLKLTQSWINYGGNNSYHHKHTHPNSFLSGVFYFQSNPLIDRINFHNDTINKQLKIYPKEPNYFNSEFWWFKAIAGELVLFPSTLSHEVYARQESNLMRISLSFNTFFKGTLGNSENSTELTLLELK